MTQWHPFSCPSRWLGHYLPPWETGSLTASPHFSQLSWDFLNQVYVSRQKYFRELHTGQYSLFWVQEKVKIGFLIQNKMLSSLKSSSISIFMFGSYYSVGRRAAGSHGQQLKKEKWKFPSTGCAFLYAPWTSMNWSNTKQYSGHLSYFSSPTDEVLHVLRILSKSLTLKATFLILTWPCYTREETYIHTMCRCWHTAWRLCLNTSSIQI